MDVLGPGRAGLLDERAEHALVPGHGSGVRRRGTGAGGGRAHLEHRHAHAPLRAARQGLAEQLPVAVGLEVERDRPDLVLLRQRLDPAGGVRVTAFPQETTVCSRRPRRVASALTATLPLWDTSATRPGSSGRRASPQSAARSWIATIPFPLGPQTGRSCRAAAVASSRSSSAPSAISPKPAPYTTAPPQPAAPACSTAAGTPAAGIATTTASAGSGRSASVGKHGTPCASERPGLTPQTVPG